MRIYANKVYAKKEGRRIDGPNVLTSCLLVAGTGFEPVTFGL